MVTEEKLHSYSFSGEPVGALILLLGLLAIGFFTGGFDYNIIKTNAYKIPLASINLIIFSIMIGFGIKTWFVIFTYMVA